MSSIDPNLNVARIEAVCTRYEQAWQTGQPPCWEDFLSGWVDPERAALLERLLAIDQAYCATGPALHPLPLPATVDEVTRSVSEQGQATTASAFDSPSLTSGRTISPELPPGYELLGELGRGGMGVVYRVRQVRLNRVCALKMILAGGHAGQRDLQRFQTEAQAIARLQHPGIVQIFEVGEHLDRGSSTSLPFMALELCAGGTLDQHLRNQPPTARQAARMVRDLALAMSAAHAANVIHRDLKPGNVLIAADGSLKVTDFGLARKLDEEGQTHTGAVMGTPSFMPPEQARGEANLGPEVDIYALGAILYAALTGRPPFRGATVVETLHQVLHDEPVPVRQLNPTVPLDLETICHKCLRKEAAQRYASAEHLAEELQRFREGRPILARPVGTLERGYRWVRRNPVVSTLTATVFAVLSVGVITAWILAAWALTEKGNAEGKAEAARLAEEEANRLAQSESEAKTFALDQKERAEKNEKEARDQEAKARAARADAEREASSARAQARRAEDARQAILIEGVQKALEARSYTLAKNQLLDMRPEYHQAWETRHLRQRWKEAASPGMRYLGLTRHARCVAFSPDGQRILAGGTDGQAVLWNVDSDQPWLKWSAHRTTINAVAFTPDGKRLLTAGFDGVATIWQADTGTKVTDLRGHAGSVSHLAVRRDSKRILTASVDRTARLWDAETGKELTVLKEHPGAISHAVFSPDDRWILTVSAGDTTARLWNAETGELLHTLRGRTSPLLTLAISPDGKWITGAGAFPDTAIQVWDVDSGEIRMTLKGHRLDVNSVSISPDAKRVASISKDQTARLWDAATGVPIGLPRNTSGEGSEIRFSPDNRHLLVRDSSFNFLWNPEAGHFWQVPSGATDGAAFSPDGKRLLLAGSVPTLWGVGTDPNDDAFQAHQSAIGSVQFNSGGDRLFTGGRDRTVRVWDFANRRPLATTTTPGESDPPQPSMDGRRFLTRDKLMGVAWIWDTTTSLALFNTPPGQTTAVLHADGNRFVTGGKDGVVRLWEVAARREVRALRGHEGEITSVSFSPDGTRILSTSRDRTARIWDSETGEVLLTLRGHTQLVGMGAFRQDGKYLLTGGPDGKMCLWDAASGELRWTALGHAGNGRFSPCGRYVLDQQGRLLRVWEAETGRLKATLRGFPNPIASVVFSPDSRRVLTADGIARLWDVETGQEMIRLASGTGPIFCAAFTPEGNTILAGDGRGNIQVWTAPPSPEKGVLKVATTSLNPQPPPAIFSPDGLSILTVGDPGTLQIWDEKGGEFRPYYSGNTGLVTRLVRSDDGKRLLTLGPQGTPERLWDTASGQAIHILRGHIPVAVDAAFTRNGNHLVTVGDKTARVWDTRTGQTLRIFQGHSDLVTAVAISPDGKTVVTASRDKTAQLWNLETGEPQGELTGHTEGIESVAFSPDGTKVLTGGWDRTARLWDVATQEELRQVQVPALKVEGVAFSPDGRRVLTVDGHTARLWDAGTFQSLANFQGHDGVIAEACFRPDGRVILTSGTDGTIRLWEVPSR